MSWFVWTMQSSPFPLIILNIWRRGCMQTSYTHCRISAYVYTMCQWLTIIKVFFRQLVSRGSALHHCSCSKCESHRTTVPDETPYAESMKQSLKPRQSIPIATAIGTAEASSGINVDLSQSPPPVPPRQQRELTQRPVASHPLPISLYASPRRVRGSLKAYSTLGKK